MLPIVNFQAIQCNVPLTMDEVDLSKDQRYLLNISQAVHSGFCLPDLAVSDLGPVSHFRWLTVPNRLLLLYVSSAEPSNKLRDLMTYFMKCYMTVWFAVKNKRSIIDDPKHLFKLIQLSRYLPNDLQVVINPVIQRNGFFAHPENLLLCMSFDERKFIRELAMRRIVKARLFFCLWSENGAHFHTTND